MMISDQCVCVCVCACVSPIQCENSGVYINLCINVKQTKMDEFEL